MAQPPPPPYGTTTAGTTIKTHQGMESTYFISTPQPHVIIGGQPTIAVQQTPGVVFVQASGVRFDRYPARVQCPHCQNAVVTTILPVNGLLPWIACGGLFIIGCALGCCLIPFCIDDLKDCEHYCPNCRQLIGVYRRMG